MGKGPKGGTRYLQDTWWNRKRVEANVQVKDLAQMFNKSHGTVGGWFTGEFLPHEDEIYKLCDLFDVDHNTGFTKFLEAHGNYVAQHKKGRKAIVNMPDKNEEDLSMIESQKVESQKVDIFSLIYGKVSYEAFNAFIQACANKQDPLKYVYGKVSFEEYQKIVEVINNG